MERPLQQRKLFAKQKKLEACPQYSLKVLGLNMHFKTLKHSVENFKFMLTSFTFYSFFL